MSSKYDNVTWVPSDVPIVPTFQLLTSNGDPYPDFCNKYEEAINKEDGATKIGQIQFNIYKNVSESEDDPKFDLVNTTELNLSCRMRKGKFEERKYPYLEVDQETQ